MLPNFFLKLATKCLSNKLKKDNSQNGLEEQISACKEMAESIKTLIQSKDRFSDNKLAVLGETLNRIVRHATDLYIKKIEAPFACKYRINHPLFTSRIMCSTLSKAKFTCGL
jgi:hypothetical protein